MDRARRLPLAVRTLVVGLALATGVVACTSGEGPPKPSNPQLAEGWQVYKDHCATCHAPNGSGGAGPKLAGQVVKDYPNIGDQITVIEDGKGGGALPSWKGTLTPQQIEAVARYTRECLGTTHC